MSRKRKGRDVHGIVLLDKPEGYSSHRAAQAVRSLFEARKAGHTGALDPFATGMLPVCLGEATKTAGFMLDASKTYLAVARLGVATSTGDAEGEVSEQGPVPDLSVDRIEAAMARFRGEIEQVPPMYSALKHRGQPLYKLARAGKEVPREPRKVTIHSLRLVRWRSPVLEFRVHCSKGTYVRTLAEDVARELGSCAHLSALRRLRVEPFREQDMVSLDDLRSRAGQGNAGECLLPADAGLTAWPVTELDDGQAERFRHGNAVGPVADERGPVRVYDTRGCLLGLGKISENGRLEPKRVFVYG
jgi:tRNA pseudouridine55 synthase